MKLTKYFIILFTVVMVSCSSESVNDLSAHSSMTDEKSEEATENTVNDESSEELLESINFKLKYGAGTTYMSYVCDDILKESSTIEIGKLEITIDSEEYISYDEENVYIGNDYTNKLINELSILVYDKKENVVDRKVYRNLFILDAADLNLIANINQEINNAEIIYIRNGENLYDLDFINEVSNLRCLYIEEAISIKDLSQISMHNSLEILILEESRSLEDLTPIKNLRKLREVSLGFAELNDNYNRNNLEVISKMVNLEKLELTNIDFNDLNFLNDLTRLEELIVAKNSTGTDYSIIKELNNLKILKISGTQKNLANFSIDSFGNIDFLSLTHVDMTELSFEIENNIEKLEIVSCNNVNFNENSNLDSIRNLSIEYTDFEDISDFFSEKLSILYLNNVSSDYLKLDKFYDLSELSIIGHHHNCENLEFLTKITDLKSLKIYANSYMDISYIESMSSLEGLDIYYLNQSMNFEGLYNLEKLYLYAVHNNYRSEYIDISSIGKLKNLKQLIMVEVEQEEFSFIGELASLSRLEAYRCLIEQLPNLMELQKLKTITIGDNEKIVDLENLSDCVNLKMILIFGTEILDPKTIGKINSLEVMVLSNTNGFNMMILSDLSGLKYFSAKGVNLENIDEFEEITQATININE